ncbi:MAG: molybdopterin-dependent oxidoreductase [Dehalococcoidia bacterium]|nr:molybdopterin-dependent oxidoreductase [Dehalococcoidia bacterium]
MAGKEVVKSTCELCNSGCGVLVYMKDGKPVRVAGDPDSLVNRGVLCVKGMASLEYLYHPDRLKYPMKRAGKRGEGKWREISWDEALDTIASELTRIKNGYGAESVIFIRGCAKGYQDAYMERFANVFGTPNFANMASVCYNPRNMASTLTCGFMSTPDYEYPPACIVIWGLNCSETAIGEHWRATEALDRGSKLIVIDPVETGYAKRADIWVKPRPTTDLALALGLINVIVTENLYDKEFVDKWTSGFDKLVAHIKDYTPEKVAEITWVPADTIREVARFYATTKPACIAWGNGLDNNLNNYQCDRAIVILKAITGNLGRPGGDIEWTIPVTVGKYAPDLLQKDMVTPDMRAKGISAKTGMLPPISYALPQHIVKSLLTGEPYRLRAAYVQGASLLHTYTNVQETRKALENLEFMVAADFFKTPTVELADIALPVGIYLEINSLHVSEFSPTIGVIQKVANAGDTWSDYRIYAALAKRLGLGKHYGDDEEKMLDYLLKPSGLTFADLRKVGTLEGSKQYRKYEKSGFETPSRKVEIYSSQLEKWGFEPLPVWHEPPESPLSAPELAKEYPMVFTNRKKAPFPHSGGRQIATLRGNHPEPLVQIETDTAKKLGIADGDMVYIETKRGRIKQKAALSPNIHPRVIIIDYGWWFPEKPASELHGWADSNVNILTNNKPPFAREVGSALLRGYLCKVYKAT